MLPPPQACSPDGEWCDGDVPINCSRPKTQDSEFLVALGDILRFNVFNHVPFLYTLSQPFPTNVIHMDGVFLKRENRIWVRMLVSRRFPQALHPGARLTPTDGEAAFDINAKHSRHSGLSVPRMNTDSSLQVGRTWRGGPCHKSASATPPRSLKCL